MNEMSKTSANATATTPPTRPATASSRGSVWQVCCPANPEVQRRASPAAVADRKRGVEGKSGDLRGGPIIKKKKKNEGAWDGWGRRQQLTGAIKSEEGEERS